MHELLGVSRLSILMRPAVLYRRDRNAAFARMWSRLKSLPTYAEAATWLVFAWITLDVLPGKLYFKLIPPMGPIDPESLHAAAPVPGAMTAYIARLRRVIQRTSNALPVRSECFHQGIAAYCMLRRSGVECVLHYGVRYEEKQKLAAHVWVTFHGADVIGGPAAAGFTKIATMRNR